ncbi:NAD(P)-binding protein [Venturia nashicola]|nr:NAD(P)-binding protein [Venturia nashicola]
MQAIKKTLAENLTGGNLFSPKAGRFTLEQVPDLTGKVAVVTGGSSGIGYGVAHTFLTKNIDKVFIISDTKEIMDNATEAIKKELGIDTASKMKWLQCDLADWKAAAETANKVSKDTHRLDILVNNAGRGIMTFQLANGIDRHMALNHMGHVVLTSHLLPLLKKTAVNGNIVRITNQASNAHEMTPSDCKFQPEELTQDLGPNPTYGRSKLAAILYSRYLNRHLTSAHPNILVNATHPGVVATKMSTEDILEPYPIAGYAMKYLMAPIKKDQFEGALSTLFAATVTENSGEYICPPANVEEGSKLANDDALGEQLMKVTRETIMEKTRADTEGCPFKDY